MFIIFISMEREHSNSPQYIFVFGDEVFNKINAKFPSQSMIKIYPTHYKAKHPPERYLPPLPQNKYSTQATYNNRQIAGRQRKFSTCN